LKSNIGKYTIKTERLHFALKPDLSMEFFSVLVDPNTVHYSQVAADQLVPALNSFHCLSCLGNIRK